MRNKEVSDGLQTTRLFGQRRASFIICPLAVPAPFGVACIGCRAESMQMRFHSLDIVTIAFYLDNRLYVTGMVLCRSIP
ncbi:MAG: hypothetical protein QG552_692 [Thermodesulfobacteriota bacterium]|nr:hypothetical protein [Thermodesulfobacteriota bacterium]